MATEIHTADTYYLLAVARVVVILLSLLKVISPTYTFRLRIVETAVVRVLDSQHHCTLVFATIPRTCWANRQRNTLFPPSC